MFEVTVLASGSSGNALLVRSGECAVLVDAGLSARKLAVCLECCGVAPAALSGILLTHEHGDHTKGLKVFVEKYQGMEILPFSVPHDAADPVGFVLRGNGTGFAVLTDLGYATRQVVESVRGVHALLIETNHDEALLQSDTKRPWSVKQRILSRHGHLSNAAAAEIVAEVATDALRHVLLGHLSRDCNSPELAVDAVGARLRGGGRESVRVQCARTDEEAPMLRIVV